MTPVTPEPAATVILVREERGDLEVFMTRRQPQLKFLGGFHVFPGGKVDTHDYSAATCRRCPGLGPEDVPCALDVELAPEKCLGFFVAGIRELFEEAGVLLARDSSGKEFIYPDALCHERFKEHRACIHRSELRMTAMMELEDLYYATDRLFWFAHWITPATSPRRFDTQFFIARLPEGQQPAAFAGEIASSGWVTPGEAIEQWRRGEIDIIPPTMASLDRLSRFETWEQIQREYDKRKMEN